MLSLRLGSVLSAVLFALPGAAQTLQPTQTWRSIRAEVEARYDLERGQLQLLDVPAEATSFIVDVTLGDRPVTLKMWPHDVRSDNFQLLVQDDQGIHVEPTPASITLRGRILGQPDSMISGTLWGGKFQALVHDNLFAPESGVWAIQPIDEFGPQSPWHVVYHESDVASVPGACGVSPTSTMIVSGQGTTVGLGTGVEPLKVCEIAIDTDNQFYNLNGQSVVATQNDITTVINNVDVIYMRDVAISYEITAIIVRTSEPDPYSSSNASTLLGQFRDHWNSSQGSVQRDIAHLFTGRNISGSVIGIAWLSVICTNNNPYGLSQSRYTGNTLLRTSLTAHELGHNWSSPHCNGAGGCQIMCSSNGGCGGVTAFGPDATASILNHKSTRTCLSDPVSATLTSIVPNSLQAFQGGVLTITGTGLSGISSIDIAGYSFLPSQLNVTILDDSTVEMQSIIAPALGTEAVTAISFAGASNALSITFTETEPPVLAGPQTARIASDLTYVTGSNVGDQWFLFASPDDATTVIFQGYPILTGSFYLGLGGTLTGVGIDAQLVAVNEPALIGRTVYLHSILVNGGFAGATNVISTTFTQ